MFSFSFILFENDFLSAVTADKIVSTGSKCSNPADYANCTGVLQMEQHFLLKGYTCETVVIEAVISMSTNIVHVLDGGVVCC